MASSTWRSFEKRMLKGARVKKEKVQPNLLTQIKLYDASTASLRLATTQDSAKIFEFYRALSVESRYLRFHNSQIPELANIQKSFKGTNPARTILALKAEQIIAIGQITAPTSDFKAEISISVADEFQGLGVGANLFHYLAQEAKKAGVHKLTANVLTRNEAMLSIIQKSGFSFEQLSQAEGASELSILTTSNEASLARIAALENRSDLELMQNLFSPKAVVVVGASRQRNHVGAQIVKNLIKSDYKGKIYPVNPEAYEVNGLKSYANIADVPNLDDESFKLAILALRPEQVLLSLNSLAKAGVKVAVVISPGFADAGEAGYELQSQLIAKANEVGIRILGPASLGFFKSERNSINASLAPHLPKNRDQSSKNACALGAQSMALSAMLLAGADRRDLSVSHFISTGNRADIALDEAMNYFLTDQSVQSIALGIESVAREQKLLRATLAASKIKPVFMVMPPNHADIVRQTNPLESKLPPEATKILLANAGATIVESVDHLLDSVNLLQRHSHLHGKRIGLLSNNASLGASLKAEAESNGLDIAAENYRVPIAQDDRFVPRAFTSMAGPGLVDCVIISILDTGQANLVKIAAELATLSRSSAVEVLMVVVAAEPRYRELEEVVRANPSYPAVFSTASRATKALASVMSAMQQAGNFERFKTKIKPQATQKIKIIEAQSQSYSLDTAKLLNIEAVKDGKPELRIKLSAFIDPAFGPVIELASLGKIAQIYPEKAYLSRYCAVNKKRIERLSRQIPSLKPILLADRANAKTIEKQLSSLFEVFLASITYDQAISLIECELEFYFDSRSKTFTFIPAKSWIRS